MAGSDRDAWEREVFRGAYHERTFVPGERPKYGVLSASGIGVPEAHRYGSCFLELKNNVRSRVTLAPADSSVVQADDLGTLEHAAHVLSSGWLSTGRRSNVPSTGATSLALGQMFEQAGCPLPNGLSGLLAGGHYREIHIHGPVAFDQDVARVVASADLMPTHRSRLDAFSEKFGIPLFWNHGDQLIPEHGF